MPSVVTRTTERDAIRRRVSQVRTWSPRMDMVHNQLPTASAAVLASIIIPKYDRLPEGQVFWLCIFSGAQTGMASLPVGMRWPNQVRVSWRLATSLLDAQADSFLVGFGEFAAFKGLADAQRSLAACFRCHHILLIVVLRGNPRQLGPYSKLFGDVAMQVCPSNSARVSAEQFASAAICSAALFACSLKELGHEVYSSPRCAV